MAFTDLDEVSRMFAGLSVFERTPGVVGYSRVGTWLRKSTGQGDRRAAWRARQAAKSEPAAVTARRCRWVRVPGKGLVAR
jgi:hypothetical protein